jgi:hypothetical protein
LEIPEVETANTSDNLKITGVTMSASRTFSKGEEGGAGRKLAYKLPFKPSKNIFTGRPRYLGHILKHSWCHKPFRDQVRMEEMDSRYGG